MLKHGEVNPLNVHGLRKLEHCPPHFECVLFDSYVTDKQVSNWIYENLSGRFYIGFKDVNSSGASFHRQLNVGFERPAEASYFSLFLQQINTPPDW